MLEALLCLAYLTLPVIAWWRSRSISWTVVTLAASISIFGVGVNFAIDQGHAWSRPQLQGVLLVSLLVVAALSFLRARRRDAGMRRQFGVIVLPALVVGAVVALITIRLTEQPAFLTPVSFLMGHYQAEDNSKWLDFTSQLATGHGIVQAVPMGGPLQLLLTGFATVMGVVSLVLLHGYNEVAVAANTVVLGEYAMAILAPLVLAPLAEARLKRPAASPARGWARVPGPLVWLGSGILVVAVVLVTAYGHLTWQFTALIATLWIATFLAGSTVPRARLLTSLVIAAGMTVWVPLNVLAVLILVVAVVTLLARGFTVGPRRLDWWGLVLTALVAIGLWEPIRSSLAFLLSGAAGAMAETGLGGAGVRAVARIATAVDETLFAAGGGTEAATPILAALAAVSALGAIVVVSRQLPAQGNWVRTVPIVSLIGYAVFIGLADQWFTGTGPNYGARKFMFLAVVAILAACVPLALMLLDPLVSGMTLARWGGVLVIVALLVVDSILPRTVAALRPQQWSPPPRFADNPRTSWWPAEVKPQPEQPISSLPIACVFLPQGASAPSALTDLPDPQHAYACTRILAGLSGQDAEAQPLVDWLRREWFTNTGSWSIVHSYLDAMPDEVKRKPVILLDRGSNVIGLDPLASLLSRFPPQPADQ